MELTRMEMMYPVILIFLISMVVVLFKTLMEMRRLLM